MSSIVRTPRVRTAAFLLSAGLLAACNESTGPGKIINLSFVTRPAGPVLRVASLDGAHPSAAVSVTSGANTLVISKAQLVLSRIELQGSASAGCTESTADDCEEMKIGPSIIDLPVDQSVATSVTASVPAGTYSEVEAKIDAVQSGESGASAFLAANPSFAGVSVRVEGTYNGQPFVYTSNVESELELQFPTPLVVDQTGMNLTVHVDLAGWFTDGSGNLVDPSTANAGGANASLVADNIKRSFHAFEDDDRDGQEDHR
jgi:predicted small secreted protein